MHSIKNISERNKIDTRVFSNPALRAVSSPVPPLPAPTTPPLTIMNRPGKVQKIDILI